jgi:hypothetical protein
MLAWLKRCQRRRQGLVGTLCVWELFILQVGRS